MNDTNSKQKRKRSDDSTNSNKRHKYWSDKMECRSQFVSDRISDLMYLNQMMESSSESGTLFAEEVLKIIRSHTRIRGICRVSPLQSSVNLPNASIELASNSELEANHDDDEIQAKKMVTEEILRLQKYQHDPSQSISSPLFNDLVAFVRDKRAIRPKSVIVPMRRFKPINIFVDTGVTQYWVVARPHRSAFSDSVEIIEYVAEIEGLDGDYYCEFYPTQEYMLHLELLGQQQPHVE